MNVFRDVAFPKGASSNSGCSLPVARHVNCWRDQAASDGFDNGPQSSFSLSLCPFTMYLRYLCRIHEEVMCVFPRFSAPRSATRISRAGVVQIVTKPHLFREQWIIRVAEPSPRELVIRRRRTIRSEKRAGQTYLGRCFPRILSPRSSRSLRGLTMRRPPHRRPRPRR